MSTMSFRISEEDEKLIKQYVSINNLNLSDFIRDALLDIVEAELSPSEEKRILKAWEKAKKENKWTSHDDLWEEIGI